MYAISEKGIDLERVNDMDFNSVKGEEFGIYSNELRDIKVKETP